MPYRESRSRAHQYAEAVRLDMLAAGVATSVALEHDLAVVSQLSNRAPAYLYQLGEGADSLAFRIDFAPDDAEVLHQTIVCSQRLSELLRANGAPMSEPVGEPRRWVSVGDQPVKGVITLTKFVPDSVNAPPYEHGYTLGALHSTPVTEQMLELNVPFDPLGASEAALAHLREEAERGRFLEAGGLVADQAVIDHFAAELASARELLGTAQRRALELGRPLKPLHNDAWQANFRANKKGVTIIDNFDLSIGALSEYETIGRVRGDWVQHFGQSPEDVAEFEAGYRAAGGTIDEELAELVVPVSNFRHAVVMLAQATEADRLGLPVSPTLLRTSLHRLATIDNPTEPWNPGGHGSAPIPAPKQHWLVGGQPGGSGTTMRR